MTNDETYNGWTNRETWCTALWLNNDEGMLDNLVEQIEGTRDDLGESLSVKATWAPEHLSQVEDIVRDYVESLFDWSQYGDEHGGQVCVPVGLLNMREDIGSLYRVNWREIAATLHESATS